MPRPDRRKPTKKTLRGPQKPRIHSSSGRPRIRAAIDSKPSKGLIEQARAYVREFKQHYGVCFDCKREYPPFVLEFDHIDPSTKKFNVGDASSVPSMEALIAEVKKCALVCSNCHKIREHQRGPRPSRYGPVS